MGIVIILTVSESDQESESRKTRIALSDAGYRGMILNMIHPEAEPDRDAGTSLYK